MCNVYVDVDFVLHLLQTDEIVSESFFQAEEAGTKVLLQDLVSTASWQHLTLVLAVILDVFGPLVIRLDLAQQLEDTVPIIRFGESKDTFVFDIGVNQSSDMETRSI